ncbi:MAG: hypothetical protein ACI4F0_01700 [Agathobacter sp.]
MQAVIVIGVVLLVLGLIRKVKHLITLGVVVAIAALILNYFGILSIPF